MLSMVVRQRQVLLMLSILSLSCTGIIGAGGATEETEETGSAMPDLIAADDDVVRAGDSREHTSSPETAGEMREEPAPLAGCVACHTDKDRLYALAPPEPPDEEEESGGG